MVSSLMSIPGLLLRPRLAWTLSISGWPCSWLSPSLPLGSGTTDVSHTPILSSLEYSEVW